MSTYLLLTFPAVSTWEVPGESPSLCFELFQVVDNMHAKIKIWPIFPVVYIRVFFHAVSLRIRPHVGLNEEKLSESQHIFNFRHVSTSSAFVGHRHTHTGTCLVQTNTKGRTEK